MLYALVTAVAPAAPKVAEKIPQVCMPIGGFITMLVALGIVIVILLVMAIAGWRRS